jgi:Na+-driven multidrug efflux pump
VFVLRVVLIAGALFLVGVGIAYAFTRDKKYLRLARWVAQWSLVLLVATGLVYVFSRVLLL